MRLREALNIQRGEVVAFVGAGGKTSALVRLGRELAAEGWRVLATTTTRIASEEIPLFPAAARWNDSLISGNRPLARLLDEHRLVFVYQQIQADKIIGLSKEIVSRLLDGMNADALLIEADGSRRLPFKAPLPHEPVIPADTTLVVPMAGLNAIGEALDESTVYNLDPIIERYGFPYGMPIQPAWIAQVLRDDNLGLKDVPSGARVVVLLNRANAKTLERARARRTAQIILQKPGVEAVAIGAVKRKEDPIFEVQRRVGAIVLAAGLSQRMGTSKVLLPWGKRTVIESIIQTLVPFRLHDLVVVTGHKSEEVSQVLRKLPARTVFNPAFAVGEMLSSLKAGFRALPRDIDACLVVMGDQPQLKTPLVRKLLSAYNEGNGTLIAPYYKEERGHPILIHRRYWAEILDLPSDKAPRDVINRYPVTRVTVDNDSILRDIDTPEKYAYEKRLAGLE